MSVYATKISEPETTIPVGTFDPNEINEAFTVDPEVVYSPIVLPWLVSKICPQVVPDRVRHAPATKRASM